jgi:hypothetical protein
MKYKYEIKEILKSLNSGNSLRATARKLGYGEIPMIEWVKRHYDLVSTWTAKKKKKKNGSK